MDHQPPADDDHLPAPTVELRTVSKCYSRDLRSARRNGLAELRSELVPGRRPEHRELRRGEFWAVRDVSLAVRPGEAIGVVGVNGAGKSTLLRLIAGITRPTEGEVLATRSMATLLDPMAGFDPVLTGRENAEVAFALAAGRRPTVDELDELLAYAQLTAAAGHPVRTYSQGMRVRLAFAVMVFVDPDVMVIDEALAVGDTAFQLQCLDRLHAHCRAGGSLVFASHSMWAFQHVASRGIHVHEGRIVHEGSPEDVADHYLALIRSQSDAGPDEGADIFQRERVRRREVVPEPEAEEATPPVPAAGDARPVAFSSVAIRAVGGGEPTEGRPLELEFELASREAFAEVTLGFMIWTADLTVCILADLSGESAGPVSGFALARGRASVVATVDPMPLLAGPYAVRAAVYDGPTGDILGMTGFEDAPWWFDVAVDPEADASVHLAGALRPLRRIEAQIQK